MYLLYIVYLQEGRMEWRFGLNYCPCRWVGQWRYVESPRPLGSNLQQGKTPHTVLEKQSGPEKQKKNIKITLKRTNPKILNPIFDTFWWSNA